MNKISKKIVIVGSGNLAGHFASLFIKKGHEIIQFAGRNTETLNALSQKFFTTNTTDFTTINPNADIYILAVSDKEISNVASKLKGKLKEKLLLHTSGTSGISVLKGISSKIGVLYPLQTFSTADKIKWSKIPFLLEASGTNADKELTEFSETLSKKNYWVNSAEREKIHLAAVLVNNFVNHLYALTHDYLTKEKIEKFDLLMPLMQQTVKKVKKINPLDAQTGPAQREDEITIKKHIKLLQSHSQLKEVYQTLTDSIIKLKHAKLQGKTK